MKTILVAVVLCLAACGGTERACQQVNATPPDVVMDCACLLKYSEAGKTEIAATVTHAADCASANLKCDAMCPGITG